MKSRDKKIIGSGVLGLAAVVELLVNTSNILGHIGFKAAILLLCGAGILLTWFPLSRWRALLRRILDKGSPETSGPEFIHILDAHLDLHLLSAQNPKLVVHFTVLNAGHQPVVLTCGGRFAVSIGGRPEEIPDFAQMEPVKCPPNGRVLLSISQFTPSETTKSILSIAEAEGFAAVNLDKLRPCVTVSPSRIPASFPNYLRFEQKTRWHPRERDLGTLKRSDRLPDGDDVTMTAEDAAPSP